MNCLIKHLKEFGSLPEETGNYGQMKKNKKGLMALWNTIRKFFLAGALMTSSAKRCSKASSSFPPKKLEAARHLATPFRVGPDVLSL